MRNFIMDKCYHPVLFFFLLPIFYIALGLLFSLQYNALNILPVFIFYLFIFINQMLENIFLRIPSHDVQISKTLMGTLELLNGLILVFFGFYHSGLASLVLFFFSLIIQLQFLFSYYDLDHLAALITNFFKIILLNGFAFYIGTNFIHTRFVPYYFGLFLPFYLYEASRMKDAPPNKILAILTGLSYIISIALLWQYVGGWSFLILVTLPFASLLPQEYSRKTTAIYSIAFSFVYIGLITFASF